MKNRDYMWMHMLISLVFAAAIGVYGCSETTSGKKADVSEHQQTNGDYKKYQDERSAGEKAMPASCEPSPADVKEERPVSESEQAPLPVPAYKKPMRDMDLSSKPSYAPAPQGGRYDSGDSLSRECDSYSDKAYLGNGYCEPAQLPNVTYPPVYEGNDRFEHVHDNQVKLVANEPVSTFSSDVDTASYSFVRRTLKEGRAPSPDSVRIEEMINYFDYDYIPSNSPKKPFRPNVAIHPTPWNPNTKLLHIGIKGYVPECGEEQRLNLVFLIDVSGSMQSSDKLPLVKQSLTMLVNTLHPDDRIAIVTYAGHVGVCLEPTRACDRRRILDAINRLGAGGSTAGAAGIELAYRQAECMYDPGRVNRVILATDGDFNVGINDPDRLKEYVARKRNEGIFLSVLGYGKGNYYDEMMQKLAQNGNGNAAYIDSAEEAMKVLVTEAKSTLFTIAKDVKFQIEFNPARVSEYRLIGYETRMLKREDFNNDRIDAGDIGAGHTVTAIYEITEPGTSYRLCDDLRYGRPERPSNDYCGHDNEYAMLKMRYKLPDEDTSTLVTYPVTTADEYTKLSKTPDDLRFAASVAAFGQILKGGGYTGGFGLDDVEELAKDARGRDESGYRSEFVRLVRLARTNDTLVGSR